MTTEKILKAVEKFRNQTVKGSAMREAFERTLSLLREEFKGKVLVDKETYYTIETIASEAMKVKKSPVNITDNVLIPKKDLLTDKEIHHIKYMEKDVRTQHGRCKTCENILKKLKNFKGDRHYERAAKNQA